jgi:hypothetical protein
MSVHPVAVLGGELRQGGPSAGRPTEPECRTVRRWRQACRVELNGGRTLEEGVEALVVVGAHRTRVPGQSSSDGLLGHVAHMLTSRRNGAGCLRQSVPRWGRSRAPARDSRGGRKADDLPSCPIRVRPRLTRIRDPAALRPLALFTSASHGCCAGDTSSQQHRFRQRSPTRRESS